MRNFGSSTGGGKITLQMWGVFDTKAAYDRQIRDFQSQNPNIKIVYTEIPFADYEKTIIDKLAAGAGPDIFMIHNTWLPKFVDKLQPAPDKLSGQSVLFIPLKDYQDQFVDVASRDLVQDGKIYAMPLYIDTLALYYNKDLFNSAHISGPPKTFSDLNDDVKLLTKLDPSGNILQSGVALGSTQNINRPTDILMSLMLQSGVQMTNPEHTTATFSKSVDGVNVGEIALQYYTDFTNPSKETYSWNDSQHYSIDAFIEGKTAMMFNYSHQIPVIRDKAAHLNFAVAAMPQPTTDGARTFANYWAPAVAAKSANSDAAWQFIQFLTNPANSTYYLNQVNKPAARRTLIDQQKTDIDLGVFAQQALTAQSWYQIDNVAIENIFSGMIDDVNLGRATVRDALRNAESRVNVLMSKKNSP